MLFYENVYAVSREYNQRFETLYVPLSVKPGLVQRLLEVVRPALAQRPGNAVQRPVRRTQDARVSVVR